MFEEWFGRKIHFELLYRGSRDGWTSECDNQGETLVVIKSEYGYVFGGYANKPWDCSDDCKNDQNCFLFTLTYE